MPNPNQTSEWGILSENYHQPYIHYHHFIIYPVLTSHSIAPCLRLAGLLNHKLLAFANILLCQLPPDHKYFLWGMVKQDIFTNSSCPLCKTDAKPPTSVIGAHCMIEHASNICMAGICQRHTLCTVSMYSIGLANPLCLWWWVSPDIEFDKNLKAQEYVVTK